MTTNGNIKNWNFTLFFLKMCFSWRQYLKCDSCKYDPSYKTCTNTSEQNQRYEWLIYGLPVALWIYFVFCPWPSSVQVIYFMFSSGISFVLSHHPHLRGCVLIVPQCLPPDLCFAHICNQRKLKWTILILYYLIHVWRICLLAFVLSCGV